MTTAQTANLLVELFVEELPPKALRKLGDAFAATLADSLKAQGLAGPGQVRVNKAGCLDRCAGGPVAVVYPEGVWYSYVDQSDIDEIVEEHLKNGRVVERLLTPPHLGR